MEIFRMGVSGGFVFCEMWAGCAGCRRGAIRFSFRVAVFWAGYISTISGGCCAKPAKMAYFRLGGFVS